MAFPEGVSLRGWLGPLDSDPGFRWIVETTLSDVPPPPAPGLLLPPSPLRPRPWPPRAPPGGMCVRKVWTRLDTRTGVSLYLPFMLWGEGRPPGSRGRLVQTS